MKQDILEFFPLETPRKSQALVIKEIQKLFDRGEKTVLLEAPVGSGKSAIAVTLSRHYGESHILTPRKGLQDQYFEDFSDHLVLMKGRSSYPCTLESSTSEYKRITQEIESGSIRAPRIREPDCKTAPCMTSNKVKQACMAHRTCPYDVAVSSAFKSDIIVHNLHSFIFQTYFSKKFVKRELMIIDEAHEIEGIIRDFATIDIRIPRFREYLRKHSMPENLRTIDDWCDWFLTEPIVSLFSTAIPSGKKILSKQEEFIEAVENLRGIGSNFQDRFIVDIVEEHELVIFRVIPEDIGKLFRIYLREYSDKLLMMSGTIYDKTIFSRNLGINSDEVVFRRIDSEFPPINRPIYLIDELMCDTSHKNWDRNFTRIIAIIKKILARFPDVKGLIHAPSYVTARQLEMALKSDRIITHDQNNFLQKLSDFYVSPRPLVFLSPICQQGVDFKGDRGRFQIVLRLPYLNTQDPFIRYMLERNPGWYEFQALVIFGQQCGRINRTENDVGATIVVDSRAPGFLKRNSQRLALWFKQAIIKKELMK